LLEFLGLDVRRRDVVASRGRDRQGPRRIRRRGLSRSSRAVPSSVKANTTSTMHAPGGTKYHHAPRVAAPTSSAALRSWPHDGWNGSPRPTNESVVSVENGADNTR